MAYPEFVAELKRLKLKKNAKRPKMAPNRFYPHSVELQTVELIRKELEAFSEKLRSAAMAGYTLDGVDDVAAISASLGDDFRAEVSALAGKVLNFNVTAFAEFSDLAVGERYFPSDSDQQDVINAWTSNFVELCKSANEEMKKKVAGRIADGVLNGTNIRDIEKDIRNTCRTFTATKAELIGTTEVGKLNTAIARRQSESSGIEYYEWGAAMDGRTRESHAVMDGKICKWGDDTHYYAWEDDPKKPGKRKLVRKDRPKNAYMGAPGTDFRCRCVALPYVPEFEDDYEETREKGEQRGVLQGKNSSAATMELLKKSLAEQAVKRLNRSLNKALKRAKGFARERGEKNAEFTEVEPYIWSDARQAKKDKSSDERVQKEMEMARIAVRNGYAVVRLYENSGSKRKNPDCCMDELVTEMKRCKFAKLEARLRDALEQAPNAFIQLEEDKSHTEIMEALKLVKENIEKDPEQKAKNKERFRKIRSNLYSAFVFISSGNKFFRVKLSRLK